MKLVEVFAREAIVEGLQVKDKKAALKALVDAIRTAHKSTKFKPEEVLRGLLKREDMGSTGIGGGVALPHAKLDGVSGLMGIFGRMKSPLEWGAVDGEKVDLVFVIVSPAADPNAHLAVLQRVNRGVRMPNMTKFLRAAKTPKDIQDIFREIDDAAGGA